MKHKGIESRNDDILTKEDVASLLELAESLSGTYTAWGRTFWSNGKPQNITSSPISSYDGGLYVTERSGATSMVVHFRADYYNADKDILYLGRGTAANGHKTRLCGNEIDLVSSQYPYTAIPSLIINSGGAIIGQTKTLYVKNYATDDVYEAMKMNSSNDFLIGQGVGTGNLNTYIYGNTITLCHGGTKSGAALVINADMTVSIPKSLKIGESLKIGTLVLSEGTGSNAGKLLVNGSVIY